MSQTASSNTPPSEVDIRAAREELDRARRWMRSVNLERDLIIDAMFACYLMDPNVLLLGPPGTAKTKVAYDFARVVGIPREGLFYLLLHKSTAIDELFGPIMLSGLEHDEYKRKLRGLAHCRLAILDEIFKGPSAVLNASLTVLNEHQIDNDGVRVSVPLEMAIGCSNEMPEPSLDALFDRFLARFYVDEISDAARTAVLGLPDADEDTPPRISSEAITTLRAHARRINAGIRQGRFPGVIDALVWFGRGSAPDNRPIPVNALDLSTRRIVQARKFVAGLHAIGFTMPNAIRACWPVLWGNDVDRIPEVTEKARVASRMVEGAMAAPSHTAPPTPPTHQPPLQPPPLPPPPPPSNTAPKDWAAHMQRWVPFLKRVRDAHDPTTARRMLTELEERRARGDLDYTGMKVLHPQLDSGPHMATWEELEKMLLGRIGRR